MFVENAPKVSPMMSQWHQCKEQAKEALVFFRLGDFYEAFYDDAMIVATELGLTLTKRQEVPMCGVPHHACEGYLEKLVSRGFSVAMVEQVPQANMKGIIDRKITRIITPGTLMSSQLLEKSSSQFIASASHLNQRYGLAFLELSTGEFFLLEFDSETAFFDELYASSPRELLLSHKLFKHHKQTLENYSRDSSCKLQLKEEWYFDHHSSLKNLLDHFGVQNLDAFKLEREIAGINAAGALIGYVKKELRQPTDHIQTILKLQPSDCLKIDRTTATHLELLEPLREGFEFTLLNHLDETETAMGFRLLSKWIRHPLIQREEILGRQMSIKELLDKPASLERLRLGLSKINDLERLTSRVASKLAGPRDLYQLGLSLSQIPKIQDELASFQSPLWKTLLSQLSDFSALFHEILSAINPEAPLKLSDGNVFLATYHAELSQLRSLRENSDRWLLDYQEQLRRETEIKTLKVSYSRAFGYFIEVSRVQATKMPPTFQRRQTLVNAERFLSPELHEFECKVLTAEEKLSSLEKELFERLELKVYEVIGKLQMTSRSIAQIDSLQSLSHVAKAYGYIQPAITEETILEFTEAKHPLLSAKLGSNYIPSDLSLNTTDLIHLVTGPNMGGKSTFLRTSALLVVMAQMGSFLPCKKAIVGIRDQLFTRIGASDDLARGRSTFLVEMSETAQILRFATTRSLVILDEIGRGTSTYDGLSIAWAVTEYLHQKKIPTLFATHYFELTALEEKFPSIKNFHVSAFEKGHDLVFLHRIEKGAADKSYGIQVAKMAGVPLEVVRVAQELLQKFQKNGFSGKRLKEKTRQLTLFAGEVIDDSKGDLLIEELKKLKVEELSPLEAFKQLLDWKNRFHV